MPYMMEVQYEKPVQPDRSCGEKINGGSTDRLAHRTRTNTKPSASRMKQSIPMLLITDGRLGHSDVHIDDDDFVDPQPRWKGTSVDGDLLSRERKSADTTDPHIPDSNGQLSNNQSAEAVPSYGLPVKRFPKPTMALQSPYVVDQVKQMKSSGNVVVFEQYNQHADDIDIANFQNWFQRGNKSHNKFNDDSNVVVTDERLIDDIIGAQIPLTTP
ncbi:Hypothetical predicted protein [Olea europaea subsp. europaea]|uniref:Uncharacterized protein n=1 Tax=Olea europaea subsp. europaea TaxID=158383 RepID=A0A8S0QBR3_OLEEU|nr:Hypothetical predicted protein [Olea europaea subsp. europaea]